MASHIEKGCFGEEVACRLLEAKGYRILELNWRCVHREIDIIAQDGGNLVIVEVKTRKADAWVKARNSVNNQKIKNLVLATNYYARTNNIDLHIRYDIIAVETLPNGNYSIEHIPDAFKPPIMGPRWRNTMGNKKPKAKRKLH